LVELPLTGRSSWLACSKSTPANAASAEVRGGGDQVPAVCRWEGADAQELRGGRSQSGAAAGRRL